MYICIAGKSECSINAIKILTKYKISKKNIYILPNSSDNGRDSWQPSLKKYAKRNVRSVKDILTTDSWARLKTTSMCVR